MKKYILVGYNLLRIMMYKLLYRKQFKSAIIQLLSPLSSIKVFEQGKITLGNKVITSKDCSFLVAGKGEIIIGDTTYFNMRCMISCQEKVKIGNQCLFGPDVKIFDNDHYIDKGNGIIRGKHKTSPVIIGNNVWIGANVTILRGVQIGSNSVVGAGAVVNYNVNAGTVIIPDRNYQTRIL